MHHQPPPPYISLSKEFGLKGVVVPPGTTIYPNYISDQGTACTINQTVREKTIRKCTFLFRRGLRLTERSATELCCLSQYLLENVREGRAVVPYLLRCHSPRTSKGGLGWVRWGLCNCLTGWLARSSPSPVNAVNNMPHQSEDICPSPKRTLDCWDVVRKVYKIYLLMKKHKWILEKEKALLKSIVAINRLMNNSRS